MSNDNKPLVSPGVRVILTDETINIVRDGQTIIPGPFRSPLRGVPTELLVWWDVEYDLLAEWESDPQMFADWEVDVQLVANWEVDVQLVANWEVDGLITAGWESDPQMFADWEVDPSAEPPVGEIVLQWTESRAAVDPSYMATVAYGENTYVAGWYNPITQYSSDGSNWSTTGSPAMTLAQGSAYGQGKFLMSGFSSISVGPGRLASSADGTTWVAETNPFTGAGNDSNLGQIIYSPELDIWMLFARGQIGHRTSSDGVTWSNLLTIPGLTYTYKGSWGDGKFVVSDTRDIAISTDGVNWTVILQANHAMDILSDRINATVAHDGMIIALGKSFSRAQGSGMYSTDNGATWNLISVPGHDNILFQSVEYGNDRYIATGSFNIFPSYLVSSTDGINWALEEGFVYSSSGGGYDIVYNSVDNEWVMVGNAGYTARGQYVEVFPPPPIPDPGPPVSGDWSTDLIATTGTSGTQETSPVNIYYRRRLFTTTYTSDEIVAATGKNVATISGLRFLVSQQPLNQPLPNYAIGMKATGNLPSLNNSGTAGGTFTLAKNATDESFTTGVVKEFIFDTPVVWIEGYNLVVSWAWGQVQPDYDASGQMPVGLGNSYHAESDDAGAFNIADEATLAESYRPVIQLRT